MKTHTSVTLRIGNAVPHGTSTDSARIVELWRNIVTCFDHRAFSAISGNHAPVKEYRITLDASELLNTLELAIAGGGFDNFRRSWFRSGKVSVESALTCNISGADSSLEACVVATVFLQQLVMAANIVLPGSIQILDARFTGEQARLVEACTADAIIFSGVRGVMKGFRQDLSEPDFSQVWEWLESAEVSRTHTALSSVNKVLLTLLKVAEQRSEYSARTVLLVLYQLEMLLDCHTRNDPVLLRKRMGMTLGDLPESVDSIHELHLVRNELFTGTQPVHRPQLLSHTPADELDQQFGQHDMAVINGCALVIALLRQLVAKNAHRFVFSESLTLQ